MTRVVVGIVRVGDGLPGEALPAMTSFAMT
jgi:hypothetical protein